MAASRRCFLVERGDALIRFRFLARHRPNDLPWLDPGRFLAAPTSYVDFAPRRHDMHRAARWLSSTAEGKRRPNWRGWMRRKPTVLINLGSAMTYSITQSNQMMWKRSPRSCHRRTCKCSGSLISLLTFGGTGRRLCTPYKRLAG